MSDRKPQLWLAPDEQVAQLAFVLWVVSRHIRGAREIPWEEVSSEVKDEFRGYARHVLERRDRPGWIERRAAK